MLFHLFESLRNLFTFSASYSNQVFKDPLTEQEEQEAIQQMQQGNKEARNILKQQLKEKK